MATLAGKSVVVVGGTSGIGFGVAKGSLISFAATVVVASSSKAKVENAVARLLQVVAEKHLPGKVSGWVVDADHVEEVKKFIEGVGEIDHLVWTSGRIPNITGGFSLDLMQQNMNLRYWSPLTAAKSVKIRSGGSITFTLGTAIFKPRPGWGIGASIGGARDALTRGLAVELAPVRVNAISPGLVDTELIAKLPVAMKDAFLKEANEKLLVKHVADADELAEAYLFTMKCNYVTGQTIHVEGGMLLV